MRTTFSVSLSLLSLFVLWLVGAPAARADETTAARREADRAVHLASNAARNLLGLLDESRRGGNATEELCLDAALTQVNSFARLLEARRSRLEQAERGADPGAARHERRVIRTLVMQLRERAREGHACVEEGPRVSGRTEVTVLVDAEIPLEDVALDPWPRGRWD